MRESWFTFWSRNVTLVSCTVRSYYHYLSCYVVVVAPLIGWVIKIKCESIFNAVKWSQQKLGTVNSLIPPLSGWCELALIRVGERDCFTTVPKLKLGSPLNRSSGITPCTVQLFAFLVRYPGLDCLYAWYWQDKPICRPRTSRVRSRIAADFLGPSANFANCDDSPVLRLLIVHLLDRS